MADEADLPPGDDVDESWAKWHDVKGMGCTTPTYSTLLVLFRALLALPASNADSERFSMFCKIDTEERTHFNEALSPHC
jgi:hypothetical protein